MAAAAEVKNAAVDAVTGLGPWISIHTDDPGDSGDNEAESASYSRQETGWPPATDGTATGDRVTFDLGDGLYTHFGVWSDETGGDFLHGGPIEPTELFSQSVIRLVPTVTWRDLEN